MYKFLIFVFCICLISSKAQANTDILHAMSSFKVAGISLNSTEDEVRAAFEDAGYSCPHRDGDNANKRWYCTFEKNGLLGNVHVFFQNDVIRKMQYNGKVATSLNILDTLAHFRNFSQNLNALYEGVQQTPQNSFEVRDDDKLIGKYKNYSHAMRASHTADCTTGNYLIIAETRYTESKYIETQDYKKFSVTLKRLGPHDCNTKY